MRFDLNFLLAALLSSPAALRAAGVEGRVQVTEVRPLIQLGGLIHGIAPGLAATPWALGTVPAALRPENAAILAELAGPAPAAVAPADASAVLRAVNATLQDVSPEQLRSMPAERLQAVASIIMDQMAGGRGPHPVEGIAALSEASQEKMLSLRGRPLGETVLNPGHSERHEEMVTVRGAPEVLRRLRPIPEPARSAWSRTPPPGIEAVFRHYTTQEGLEGILASGALRNGFVPYVQLASGLYRKTFRDISGVFLTQRSKGGIRVGVPGERYPFFVDLRVPTALPLLEAEPGAIYLIPLPGRTRDWVKRYHDAWLAGEPIPDHYRSMVLDMDAEGGPGPDLSVPVEIVRHGRTR